MIEISDAVRLGWTYIYAARAAAFAAEHAPGVAELVAVSEQAAQFAIDAEELRAAAVQEVGEDAYGEAVAEATARTMHRAASIARLEEGLGELDLSSEGLDGRLRQWAVDAIDEELLERERCITEHGQAVLGADDPAVIEGLTRKLRVLTEQQAQSQAGRQRAEIVQGKLVPPVTGEGAVEWRKLVAGVAAVEKAIAEAREAGRPSFAEVQEMVAALTPDERARLLDGGDLLAAMLLRWDTMRTEMHYVLGHRAVPGKGVAVNG